MKRYRVLLFGKLTQEAGSSFLELESAADTPRQLYAELQQLYSLTVPLSALRVAMDEEFAALDDALDTASTIAFMPPMAGG